MGSTGSDAPASPRVSPNVQISSVVQQSIPKKTESPSRPKPDQPNSDSPIAMDPRSLNEERTGLEKDIQAAVEDRIGTQSTAIGERDFGKNS